MNYIRVGLAITMIRISLYCLLLLLLPSALMAQNFNRPVPDGLTEYEFQITDSVDLGYYLFTPLSIQNGGQNDYDYSAVILDKDGYLTWYWRNESRTFVDFNYSPDHNLFTVTNLQFVSALRRYVLDENMELVDSIIGGIPGDHDTHDFQILDNGNYLVVGSKDSTMDLSAYSFNGVQGSATTWCKGFTIFELDAMGNILFAWNSNDHMHPSEFIDTTYNYNVNNFDYAHGNSVDEDDDGNFLVSFRHTNSIIKIDKSTGNIIWRLGGRLSDFTWTNDQYGFSGQHDARRLPNGNIGLFDNMNSKSPPPIRSRALEVSLDTVNMTATREWKYRYLPGFFARAQGSYQRTPSNYHLLNFGSCLRPNPSAVVVDPQDSIVATLLFRDSVQSYRGRLYDLPFTFDRPEVTCVNNGGVITLTAPAGYDDYLWSNGDTTASITVSAADTYQVWVNHGVGMLGSQPVIIDDVQSFCIIDGIEDEGSSDKKKEIVEVWDILGRPVQRPEANTLYIVRYADNSTARIYWTESMRLR